MKILQIKTKDSCASYLQAVGMGEGDDIEVVRAAPFGGPIQLRLALGTDFMIGRDIASRITVNCGSHVHPLTEPFKAHG